MNTTRREFVGTLGLGFGAFAAAQWRIDAAVLEPGMPLGTKRDLADLALGAAKKLGASYADIRINRYRTESISTREKRVLGVSRGQSFGFGVRVLVKGAWGFASSNDVSAKAVRRVVREAIDIAKANAQFQKRKFELVPVEAVETSWRSSYKQDPFNVPIEKKIELLLGMNDGAMSKKGVGFASSDMDWVNEQKFLGT